jgi:hypothetical protein
MTHLVKMLKFGNDKLIWAIICGWRESKIGRFSYGNFQGFSSLWGGPRGVYNIKNEEYIFRAQRFVTGDGQEVHRNH